MEDRRRKQAKEWRQGLTILEIVEFDAEGFAAVEIVEEGIIGLVGFGAVFLGEVHEVGAVRENVARVGYQLLGTEI